MTDSAAVSHRATGSTQRCQGGPNAHGYGPGNPFGDVRFLVGLPTTSAEADSGEEDAGGSVAPLRSEAPIPCQK